MIDLTMILQDMPTCTAQGSRNAKTDPKGKHISIRNNVHEKGRNT
jgi:hypothetical protein